MFHTVYEHKTFHFALLGLCFCCSRGENCSCKPPNDTSLYDFYCFRLREKIIKIEILFPHRSTEISHSHYQTNESRTQEGQKCKQITPTCPWAFASVCLLFSFFLFFLFPPLMYILYLFKQRSKSSYSVRTYSARFCALFLIFLVFPKKP